MNRLIILLFLIGPLMSSCTEEIDVELDTTYTRLVVDGSIAADTGAYRVLLTTTSGYFSNSPAPKVPGASLILSDGTNSWPLRETIPGSSAIYLTESSFSGQTGKKYTLDIELAEPIGGERNFQATSVLYPVTKLDSVSTMFHPEWGPDGIWSVKLWAQEPGNEVNYYMFNLYRNGTLITDTISKKVVSDDKFYNGSYMTGVDVIYLNNEHPWETLRPGDTIILQMSAITEEYFNFINQVRQSGFTIPFFSGPPANVQGNISNGGIGFFAAWSDSYKSCIVK